MTDVLISTIRVHLAPPVLACAVALALGATAGSAQRADLKLRAPEAPSPAVPAPSDDRTLTIVANGGWHGLRIAKWTIAGVTAGTALYGFISHNRADDLYRDLEELCIADSQRCLARTAAGAYSDSELETRYQEMRAVDRRARSALLAGQVGVAATVVLFILDLRNRNGPSNIPYEPPGMSVQPASDGGYAVGFRVRW